LGKSLCIRWHVTSYDFLFVCSWESTPKGERSMKRFSYRQRDDAFGQSMLALRTSLGLTQAELAQRLGVSGRAVREWEAGSSYPKAPHLQHVITLAVQQQAMAATLGQAVPVLTAASQESTAALAKLGEQSRQAQEAQATYLTELARQRDAQQRRDDELVLAYKAFLDRLAAERGVSAMEGAERHRDEVESCYRDALATDAPWLKDDQLRREFMGFLAEIQAGRRETLVHLRHRHRAPHVGLDSRERFPGRAGSRHEAVVHLHLVVRQRG